MRLGLSMLLASMLTPAIASEGTSENKLVIHEWGTFTSFQDDAGRTIGGLTTDEEHLPAFVHDLRPVYLGPTSEVAPRLSFKGVSVTTPSVTMRLETPVVYFYLPPGKKEMTVDLSVSFTGGILSQFYPFAEPQVNDLRLRWQNVTYLDDDKKQHTVRQLQGAHLLAHVPKWEPWQTPTLSRETTSSLTWRDIHIGGQEELPETNSHVWLAPREVAANNVRVGSESERYLFYRGVAHRDAPLVARRVASDILQVTLRSDDLGSPQEQTKHLERIPTLWLADLRGDGTAAFRKEPMLALPSHGKEVSRHVQTTFSDADYSAERLATLRGELKHELVTAGLFADEADAMLNTWEVSYFKSAGQRIFFVLPQSWTDAEMPMTVSTEATITRVMMGRIEVMSSTQRQALSRISQGPISDPHKFKEKLSFPTEGQVITDDTVVLRDNWNRPGYVVSGQLPDDYKAYVDLGRFRDALLWHDLRHRPTPGVRQFLNFYVLQPHPGTWQPWEREVMEAAGYEMPVQTRERIGSSER